MYTVGNKKLKAQNPYVIWPYIVYIYECIMLWENDDDIINMTLLFRKEKCSCKSFGRLFNRVVI